MICPACGSGERRNSSAGSGNFEGFVYSYIRCAHCKTLYVDPPPPPQFLLRMYSPEYIDAHYGMEIEENSDENTSIAMESARIHPKGTLLDIGCGGGHFLREARKQGLEVEGFELSQATAQKTADRSSCVVHHTSLATIQKNYDVAHLADVLEHSLEPLSILKQAVRLVPNGYIVARGPLEGQVNLYDFGMRTRRFAKSLISSPAQSAIPPWHLILFSRKGWNLLAQRAGMQCVREAVSETSWPAPTYGPKAWLKKYSRAFSESKLGKRFYLGNRIISVWKPILKF